MVVDVVLRGHFVCVCVCVYVCVSVCACFFLAFRVGNVREGGGGG